MLISTSYEKDGIIISLLYKGLPVSFPLATLDKQLIQDPEWGKVNALEQIWYQGLLVPAGPGKYVIHEDDFYELDQETILEMPITHFRAEIGIREHGNVGSRNYKISWYTLIRGKDAGKCERKGVVVLVADFAFLLSKEQHRLICEIENPGPITGVPDRARLQAKCKFLAKKAGVKTTNFMENRDFLFADDVEMQVSSVDDSHIQIEPELEGIEQEVAEALPRQIRSIQQVNIAGKRTHVFTSPGAQAKYNQIGRLPEINGTDVPRFLDNPKAFIPEEITFDEDLFSKRVKGLKIRRSSAVPFINLEPNDEKTGWFDINSGITLHDISGEEEDQIVDSVDVQKRLEEAAEAGQDYVYINNSWVRVDSEAIKKYQAANKEWVEEFGHDKKIAAADIGKLLDIYDNVNGIEYNENILKLREQGISSFDISPSLNVQLREYQHDGYSFLLSHYMSKTGVLLADDMGLGKTVQVIALMAYMQDEDKLKPALVVMPNALIENWEEELITKLKIVLRIYKHQGPGRYRTKDQIRRNDIVLTTYETLARDQVLLGTIEWSCVICDEVQKIKNFRTYAAAAVKGMNTKCKIAMTGTPVENRLSELWSISDFVQPGLLNSYQHFRNEYERPIQSGNTQKADELITALSPVFLRRTKEDVLGDILPGKTEYREELQLNLGQKELYQTIIDEVHNSDENITLASIQKLIMLCSHPRLVSKETLHSSTAAQLEQESPKLAWTVMLLRKIQKAEEKAIIFTGYKAMQAILRQVIFEEFMIDAKIINGDVTGNRLDIISSFGNKPGFNVLILAPRAAGVGLNIVSANHVIHYTREWNPAIENQATDRAYRIGQKKPVSVYYPIMGDHSFTTAEARLDELLMKKRALMKNVIVPSDLTIKWQEFEDIL